MSDPNNYLETFENPSHNRDYLIEIITPEFTCLCPKTGQPDFAKLTLKYQPNKLCVELKSYKLYMHSFRDRGSFHEAVTNMIAEDLIALLNPKKLQIHAEFNVRGGIFTNVTVNHKWD